MNESETKAKKHLVYAMRERLLATQFWKQQEKDFNFILITDFAGKESYDLIISSAQTKSIIEIKTRSFKSSNYKTAFIEIYKYNKLFELAQKFKCQPYYWVFFEDNKLAIFDLKNFQPIVKLNQERNGHDSIESTTIINEPIYELPLKQAVIYNFPIPPANHTSYSAWAKQELEKRYFDEKFSNIIIKGNF
jgi:hypothetical protein